jgi:hypothetical protein
MKISLNAARRLALKTQLLYGTNRLSAGKEGVAQSINQLGYVQIDTIAVIERAHHHTLWTRCPNYNQEMLHELQAVDRRIFEYWGHAMSYLPMCDYRFYLPRMKKFYDSNESWVKRCLIKCDKMLRPVKKRIIDEGPLTSKDFKPPLGTKSGPWWGWQPAKVALELLFWRGELMITERRKFQKVYDLTERVLPDNIDTRYPDNDELGQFIVRKALTAYGIARENEICNYINWADKGVVKHGLKRLLEAGEVMKARIENSDDYFYLADNTKLGIKKRKSVCHIISPFDSLIIQRERTERLFGFDYALECYVPASKRRYGYFVLPILWGDRLVGRLDPKADRKEGVFIINSIDLENDFSPDDQFYTAAAKKLWQLALFNDCGNDFKIKRSHPKKILATLKKHLKKLRP